MTKKYTIIAWHYWIAQIVLLSTMLWIYAGNSLSTVLMSLLVFIIAIVDWMMMDLMLKLSSELMIEEQIQKRKYVIENRIRYFKMLQLRNQYIRRLYHDLSNHLVTIDALQEQGRTTEREQYINNIKAAYKVHAHLCENESINLAASLYLLKCANQNIMPNISMNVSEPITVEYENSICSLFGKLNYSDYVRNVTINNRTVILDKPMNIDVKGLEIIYSNISRV
jgi:hypothetical protein